MSRHRGYEERHYDVMLIAFHALCVSENRKKPAEIASDARACADAFVHELKIMDLENEAESRLGDAPDITRDNAERDTEPPQEGGLTFVDPSTVGPLTDSALPTIDAAIESGKDLDTGAATQ